MPNKKHHIKLDSNERELLTQLSRKQTAAVAKVQKAKALLAMDCGESGPALSDENTAKTSGLSIASLERLRKRVCEVGPMDALERSARLTPPVSPKVTGEVEAKMIQIACSEPPDGFAKWTMQMIADRLIELRIVESISAETTRLRLKNNKLKPWQKESWCIPKEKDADFVAAMEDVLDVYHRPIDPNKPLVCIDEFSKQLVSEVSPPIPAQPGTPRREDYEYVREGVASGFLIAVPHLGIRQVFIGESGRRTSADYAEALNYISDVMFPKAKTIVLVQDNLNTHCRGSIYKKFEPEKANNLCSRFEYHYTPKHGSWLNMAEIEISVLARTALDQRIPSLGEFKRITSANVEKRNRSPTPIKWSFDNEKARIKLKSLYPSV